MESEYPKLIENDMLTPDLRRTRSGEHQEFETAGGDVLFSITPPENHLYAKLIDGKWFWVNGCDECNGKPAKWTYQKCKKHDVCQVCGIEKAKVTGSLWGGEAGFICHVCHDRIHEEEKAAALAAMKEDYDPWDYRDHGIIICPYCNKEYEDTCDHYEDNNEDFLCERCDNTFEVTAEHSVSFGMVRKDE